jgi:hypothetical protein
MSTHQKSNLSKAKFWLSATALWALQAHWPALAQQAAKPDSAEAAAAMERAQRSAANPMRAILQASKLAPAPRAEVAVAAPLRVAVATPAPAPVPAAAVPAVAAAAVLVASVKPTEVRYEASARMSAPATAEVFALEAPLAAVAVTEQLSAAAPSATLVNNVVTPKLKHRVDPTFPANLTEQASQLRELTVSLNIATDGSVSDVVVQSPVPRQLLRHVQTALTQWRFEPLSVARAHQVQLVFNGE